MKIREEDFQNFVFEDMDCVQTILGKIGFVEERIKKEKENYYKIQFQDGVKELFCENELKLIHFPIKDLISRK
mgnify:CR=1 FL=1